MRISSYIIPLLALATTLPGPLTSSAVAAPPRASIYETDIQPLLVARCGRCHANGKQKGKLDLGSLAGIQRGSVRNEPPAEAGCRSRRSTLEGVPRRPTR